MSRGPLEVLREVASFMAQAYPSFTTADEMCEAIAQVEALVEATRDAFDSPPDRSVARLFGQLHVSLQPFTHESPSSGLVSEGGGNG